jgi:dipeptidase E
MKTSMNEQVGDGEVLLAGGGSAADSAPIDKWLVERTDDGAKMGYIPVAMPSKKYPDCREWITSVFEPYGLTDIEMWTDLTTVTSKTVAAVDAIYIGGGNTYRLLDRVRTAELKPLLREFVANGGVLYGGSAGAILCGSTVETTPDENRVDIVDSSGLGLVPTADIWCHYDSPEAVLQYVTDAGQTVVAIPERSGVSVTESRVRVVGHESISVFRDESERNYAPGEQFQFQ